MIIFDKSVKNLPLDKPKRKMKNALGANIILAQKSPQSGVIGVIGVYI